MPRSSTRRTVSTAKAPPSMVSTSSGSTSAAGATQTKWKSPMGYIGRKWLLFESTFALTMLEPWEKLLLLSVFLILAILILSGIYRYLPYHLHFVLRRARFYILGDENAAFTEAASIFKEKLQR